MADVFARDVAELAAEFQRLVDLEYALLAAQARFNAMLFEAKARHHVPPGHSIDYRGDGAIKPDADVKPAGHA